MSMSVSVSRTNSSIVIAVVAFLTWFIKGLETATIYIFFQADPKLGTAINIGCACLTLYLAVLVVVGFGYSEATFAWSRPAQWILAYVSLTGISLLWTQSYSLLSACGYWLGFTAELAVIVLLLRCGSVQNIARAALKGFVWASVAVALVAWAA